MDNLINNIYVFVGISLSIYFFITKKNMRKTIALLLLSMAVFYSSAYIFYFTSYPFNLIGTGTVLIC
ncbi:hypothetical protein BCI9360_00004 [Bacillus sp. CECT 9360]|nr:hypothetical protein BCI9360_00004 [Bacillus sp. CECT 9360]